MTSVGVIWSAVARIKCLKEIVKPPESLPIEAEQLLQGLEGIKEALREGQPLQREEEEEFGELEKKIVRLSYEIVDAIVDASSKSKEMFSVSMLSQRKKSGITKLQQLQTTLNGFQDDLKSSGSEQSPASSRSTGSEQKPKKKLSASNTLTQWGFKKLVKLERKSSRMSSSEIDPKNMIDSESEAGRELDYDKAAELKPKKIIDSESNSNSKQNMQRDSVGNDVDLFPRLRENLLNRSSEDSVVYIVGESGMGKTTFTRKLFHDLKDSFDVFAWVPINHNFQIKRVLQLLLQKLGPSQDQYIRDMNEIQLITHIFSALQINKNNLLVLDDIGSLDDWESIRLALPVANSTKVIVTTSSNDFLKLKNSYQISGLTKPDILMLLSNEASFKTGSEKIGEAIFDISCGSPLFATILGKSLQPEAATAGDQLVDELVSYIPQKGKPQVLGVCYKRLAPELKPCLLYLGQFPQGQEIEVEKLYLLLMAENLIISPKEESKTSLQSSLKDLARRKLVQVQEDYKSSCRLHDRVREFCKSKGSDEELFEIVDFESSIKVGPHTRRLAIYLSKYRGDNPIQFHSQDTLKKILSLLIFDTFESAEEKSEWPSEINDLKEFSHARVFNFDGVDFTVRKVPRGIDRLVLLRYLSFRGCRLEELPPSMSNLTQLETLDLVVHADCKKMLIPNNTFAKMTRMLHLYLPRLYAASNGKAKVQLQGLERLEILVNFDTEACDVKVLSEFKNLKTLSTISEGQANDLEDVIKFINGQAEKLQHSSVDITSFDCYNRGSASALKKLLECQFVHSIHIEGRISELPDELDSPAEKVAEIFLDGSEIEDDPMNYFGTTFQNLRSLALSNDAFLGSEIVISAESMFRNLRSLKLKNLQYLEKLTIEQGAMVELSTLIIEGCGCLEEVSIPKKMHDKLQKAQGDNGGDVYSVMPLPPTFNTTPP
ncbi:hypothetical protein C2S53_019817 [Perilla frutescens var. hirtella]|uniref:AAA+ ATPase domain-containing protein n=1 Tax=Perilla frutescens var. hirtella TaxID=608512 RepID=A0AAD4JKG3_PERFH|nr:hypothetical protein C2S53_019817 [Perilla frutescens var. hirtella]